MEEIKLLTESTASSLVREYLSRKGLKETLEKMDEEIPRSDESINNRQALMKRLHLEKLMKKNKEETQPLKAMLEVMTRFFLERKSSLSSDQQKHDADSDNGFSSCVNFGPQTNQPANEQTLQHLSRPKTSVLTKRSERQGSLILTDDVESETVAGDGKACLIASDYSDPEPPSPLLRQQQSHRPLSSKKRPGVISSNLDVLGKSKISHQLKQASSSKSSTQKTNHTLNDFEYNSSINNSINDRENYSFKKHNIGETKPVSFEDLLMKGEERATLLQKIGMEKNNDLNDKTYSVEESSISKKKSKSNEENLNKFEDLEFGDVDDVDSSLASLQLQPSSISSRPNLSLKQQSKSIDLKTAIALKNVVLGSPHDQFSDEWRMQGLTFCDLPDLKYGLIQKKGGPCGVLAAVQAQVIKELKFGEAMLPDDRYKNPTRQQRSKCLAMALADIFWRAGEKKRAVIAIPSGSNHVVNSSKFKQDGVTETLSIYTFDDYESLEPFMIQSVPQFETDGCPGVILVVYSAILSRKIPLIKGDFDSEEGRMLALHGYCSQEIVNLLLTGRAVANVFNGCIQLDSGGVGESMELKGISARSDIGFLSLFEHYKSCQVGTYFKTPKYPIWVVCSESHFSVLFSTRRDLVNDWKAERRFDLLYYDELARQQEEIRLTVSTLNKDFVPSHSEDDLVPPLEQCIRTKWTDAEIDWNGSEPIL